MVEIKKRVLCCALILLILLITPAFATQDSIRKSVVRIYTEGVDKGEAFAATGTGFAVGKGQSSVEYFITNNHVVKDAKKTYIILDEEGTLLPCTIAATSSKCDLALIHLNDPTTEREAAILRPFDAQEMALSTESVWAYGYPGVVDFLVTGGASDKLASSMSDLSVTTGTITRIDYRAQKDKGEQIIHDASVSGGNSGGPLVDKDGYVLGVNTWAVASSSTSNNADVYGAISVNEVVSFLDEQGIAYTTVSDISTTEEDSDSSGKAASEAKATDGSDTESTNWLTVLVIAGILAAALVFLIRKWKSRQAAAKAKKRDDGKKEKSDDRQNERQNQKRFSLICEAGALANHPPFALGEVNVLGRDPRCCSIVFPSDTKGVSHVHCTVYCQNGVVMVRDENSSYGTRINHVSIRPGETVPMYPGQRLYLGSGQQVMMLVS